MVFPVSWTSEKKRRVEEFYVWSRRTVTVYAIVVASDVETGGTWVGATETLRNNWFTMFVLDHKQIPEGNKLLLRQPKEHFAKKRTP